MQHDENDREWHERRNWRFGLYRSAKDTRLVVPAPVRWLGWSINHGHRRAPMVLALAGVAMFLIPSVAMRLAIHGRRP